MIQLATDPATDPTINPTLTPSGQPTTTPITVPCEDFYNDDRTADLVILNDVSKAIDDNDRCDFFSPFMTVGDGKTERPGDDICNAIKY